MPGKKGAAGDSKEPDRPAGIMVMMVRKRSQYCQIEVIFILNTEVFFFVCFVYFFLFVCFILNGRTGLWGFLFVYLFLIQYKANTASINVFGHLQCSIMHFRFWILIFCQG